MTSLAELNNSSSKDLSFLKYDLNSKGIVKTICLCVQLNTFFCICVERCLTYLLPQEEQNLDLHV